MTHSIWGITCGLPLIERIVVCISVALVIPNLQFQTPFLSYEYQLEVTFFLVLSLNETLV